MKKVSYLIVINNNYLWIKDNVIDDIDGWEGIGENFQEGIEKFQRVKRAGPGADQPSRLRTPPGVGG
jgi:hypothetical protein